jgi:hypothetical protein
VRVDLDRHVAVTGLGVLPDRSHDLARVGDVAQCELEEDALRVTVAGGDLLVVGIAVREGLGEDGRVRGDTDDGVAFDRPGEPARLE